MDFITRKAFGAPFLGTLGAGILLTVLTATFGRRRFFHMVSGCYTDIRQWLCGMGSGRAS